MDIGCRITKSDCSSACFIALCPVPIPFSAFCINEQLTEPAFNCKNVEVVLNENDRLVPSWPLWRPFHFKWPRLQGKAQRACVEHQISVFQSSSTVDWLSIKNWSVSINKNSKNISNGLKKNWTSNGWKALEKIPSRVLVLRLCVLCIWYRPG